MRRLVLRNLFTVALSTILLLSGLSSFAVQQGVAQDPPQKSAPSRSIFSSWFFQPFRSAPNQPNDKLLSNVKVFPNPTVETINLSFRLVKGAEVSIKIMDALGNEMLVLLQENLDAGNQNHSFEIQNRLSTGVYFIRLTSGTETVVKRISVL